MPRHPFKTFKDLELQGTTFKASVPPCHTWMDDVDSEQDRAVVAFVRTVGNSNCHGCQAWLHRPCLALKTKCRAVCARSDWAAP